MTNYIILLECTYVAFFGAVRIRETQISKHALGSRVGLSPRYTAKLKTEFNK